MQDKIKEWAAAFGVSTGQVRSGLGTILTVVQSRTSAGDWQKLSAAVPDAVRWATESPTISGPPVAGGQAPSDKDLLMGALHEHGFADAEARKFVAVVLSALEPVVGAKALDGLRGELAGKA